MDTTKSRDGSWSAARAWRAARAGFLHDWRSVPLEGRQRFLRTLGIGLAGVLVLTAAVAFGSEKLLAGREAELESALVLRTAEWRWLPFHKAIWFEEPGGSTMLIPLVMLATWTAARLGRTLEAVAIAAAFVGTKPILLLGRVLFDRPRPDLIAGGVASPATESFPSGHTLQAFSVWGVLAYVWIRSSGSRLERALAVVLWLTIGVVVAAARLRLGTHWPSDLAAGALLGIIWAVVVGFALRSAAGRRAST